MNNLPDKHQFIELLESELAGSDCKKLLLTTARKLIPSENRQQQLKALTQSRKAQRAYLSYQLMHPEAKGKKPSVEDLLEWLLDHGGINHAILLEEKLAAINRIVFSLGAISYGSTHTLTFDELLTLRSLASFTPILSTRKLTD